MIELFVLHVAQQRFLGGRPLLAPDLQHAESVHRVVGVFPRLQLVDDCAESFDRDLLLRCDHRFRQGHRLVIERDVLVIGILARQDLFRKWECIGTLVSVMEIDDDAGERVVRELPAIELHQIGVEGIDPIARWLREVLLVLCDVDFCDQ